MKEYELKYGCNPTRSRRDIRTTASCLSKFSGRPGYINFLDAFNAWQLVSELKAATGMAAAASFKHQPRRSRSGGYSASAKSGPALSRTEGLDDSPLASAYARARGTTACPPTGTLLPCRMYATRRPRKLSSARSRTASSRRDIPTRRLSCSGQSATVPIILSK